MHIDFKPDENFKVFLVKKLKKPPVRMHLSSLIDNSLASETNYKLAASGGSREFLEYGGKTLEFKGLSNYDANDSSPSCRFEYNDTKRNITQNFIVNPRYYFSKES